MAGNTPEDRLIGGRVRITGVDRFARDAQRVADGFAKMDEAIKKTTATVQKFPDFSQQLKAAQGALRPARPGRVGAPAAPAAPRGTPGGGLGGMLPDLGVRTGGFLGTNLGPLRLYTGLAGGISAVTAAVVGLGVAIAAATVKATEWGVELNKTEAAIRAFGQTTNQQLEDVMATSAGLSREFGVFTVEAATAGKELIKAGASVDQVTGGMERAVVLLAQVSEGEVNTAEGAALVTQTMNVFAKTGITADRVVDIITAGVQESTASFSDFETQLKTLSPVMGLLGFTAEDTGAVLEVLNNAGLRGSLAGTSMRNAMLSLLHPTKDAQEIMKQYGISLHNANGEQFSLLEVVGQLHNAFGQQVVDSGKLTEAERDRALTTLFGERSVLSQIVLSQAGVEKLTEAYEHQAGPVAERLQKSMKRNVQDQLQIVAANARVAGETFSTQFTPALTGMAEALAKFAQGIDFTPLAELGQKIQEILSFREQFTAGLFAAAVPGILAAGQAIGTLVSGLARIAVAIVPWKQLGVLLTGFVSGTSTKIIQIATAIEMVVEILVDFAEAFARGRDAAMEAVGVTERVLFDLGNTIANVINPDMVADAFASIGEFISNALSSVINIIGSFVDTVINFFSNLGNELVTGAQILWKTITDIFSQAVSGVIDILFQIFPGLAQVLEGMNKFLALFSEAWNNAVQFVKDRVQEILNILANLGSALAALDIPAFQAIGRQIQIGAERLSAGLKTNTDAIAKQIDAAGVAIAENNKVRSDAIADILAQGAKVGDKINAGVQDYLKRVKDRETQLRGEIAKFQAAAAAAFSRQPDQPAKKGGAAKFPEPTGGAPGFAPEDAGKAGKAAKEAAEDVDKLAAKIKDLLSDIPGITQELADFIAGIAKDFPERLAPMIGTLKAAKEQIIGMQAAKRQLLQTDFEIMQVEERLGDLQAQMSKLDIEQSLATIGYEKQLIGLKQQALEVERQMWPIKDAIERIDRQQAKLQRENLDLTIQRLEIELQLIPLKKAQEDLEDRRREATLRNFQAEKELLQLQIESLSTRNAIADIEEKINNLVDERQQLLARKEEILAGRDVRHLEDQAQDIEDALKKAWEKFDVPEILRLEKQREEINKALEDAKKKLDDVQDSQEDVNDENELARIELELQKQALIDSLKPYDDKIKILERMQELQDLLNQLTNVGFEEESKALEDIQKPLQDKLRAIQHEVDEENLRNQITIAHLEQEKRALQDQLEPLEDQRKAIERVMQEVEFLRAAASVEFEERKIQLQEMILREQLRQAELELTRKAQEKLFKELIQEFIDSMVASGNFTRDESVEVAKRLRMWDSQLDKIIENRNEFLRLEEAARAVGKAIDEIPKDVHITITTHHNDVYESSGGNSSAGGGQILAAQHGLKVPGLIGKPQLILAHGGERILSVSQTRRLEAIMSREAVAMRSNVTNYNYNNNFDIDPHYNQVQSPAMLRDDVRVLLMMTRK